MENYFKIDSIVQYNSLYGLETLHPLVTVFDLSKAEKYPLHFTLHYGLYALYLNLNTCVDLRYGRQRYYYREGTLTAFSPGQVLEVRTAQGERPISIGVLFHPDLIHGTYLGQEIKQYPFLNYACNEALRLLDHEQEFVIDCFQRINTELQQPIDRHSRRIISQNISLLFDYCLRYYERQFSTILKKDNDVLAKFENLLDEYFYDGKRIPDELPKVGYFADKLNMSANYFGDIVKRSTGCTARQYIRNKIMEIAKNELLGTDKTTSEIAYYLGFQYPQHFCRMFKEFVGYTPKEYRELYE